MFKRSICRVLFFLFSARFLLAQDRCYVCGPLYEIVSPDAVLTSEGFPSMTCREIAQDGLAGLISVDDCPSIQSITMETCGCQTKKCEAPPGGCNVCGEGCVSKPNAVFAFPDQIQVHCGELQDAGLNGIIPLEQCPFLPSLIGACGCTVVVDPPSSTPTLAPISPTNKPSYAPTPFPTDAPVATSSPTPGPTSVPTSRPTFLPTPSPTHSPTPQPTFKPTPAPTRSPTIQPTAPPTPSPTLKTTTPLAPAATLKPTAPPTSAPTLKTTTPLAPTTTLKPTAPPTYAPTRAPVPPPTPFPFYVLTPSEPASFSVGGAGSQVLGRKAQMMSTSGVSMPMAVMRGR